MLFLLVGIKSPFGNEKTLFFKARRFERYPDWWSEIEITRSKTIIGLMLEWSQEDRTSVSISIGILSLTAHVRFNKSANIPPEPYFR